MAVCLGTMTFAPGAVLPRGQLISLGENHIIGYMANKALFEVCFYMLPRCSTLQVLKSMLGKRQIV